MYKLLKLDKSKIKFNEFKALIDSIRTNINDEYSKKLYDISTTYLVKNDKDLIGFVSGYINDFDNKISFISYIGVIEKYRNQGIGQLLMDKFLLTSKCYDMQKVRLEVNKSNLIALNFYSKNNFRLEKENEHSYHMIKKI